MNEPQPSRRGKLFATLAVAAGLALVALEIINAGKSSTGERWFWFAVGALLVGLGVSQWMSLRGPRA